MTAAFADHVLTAFAVSAVSLTLTRAGLTQPLRDFIEPWVPPYVFYLFSCAYCMSHWIALPLAVWMQSGPWWLSWFILVGMSAVISGVILFFIPMGAK